MALSAASRPVATPENPLKVAYLTLYNFISAILWLTVLGRVLAVATLHGPSLVPLRTEEWTRWTQTGALLEILHSLSGLVRAPVFTTVIQVSSRILLVWGIVYPFPSLARETPAYTAMLLAWSVTEVIRYSFFALMRATAGNGAPPWLVWLRYSTFLVLYPLGIASEALMIWAAVPLAGAVAPPLRWALYAILVIYVPASYIMYTHMLGQRKKVLRTLATDNRKIQ